MRLPWLVACLLLCGCMSVKPEVSDTGYTGTWTKGNEQNRSTISIYNDGERYWFHWRADSEDGTWRVRCNWNGQCEEFIGGEKTSDYTFRTWMNPDTGKLMVECTGFAAKTNEQFIHYIDELEVEPGGRALWSYEVKRNDREYETAKRPKRRFTKVADTVAAPPRGTGS